MQTCAPTSSKRGLYQLFERAVGRKSAAAIRAAKKKAKATHRKKKMPKNLVRGGQVRFDMPFEKLPTVLMTFFLQYVPYSRAH